MDKQDLELVSVIIVNYNGKQYLRECIGSVLGQTYGNFELIIVENGSSDGSAGYVKNEFSDPRIMLAESKENLGFAGGNNFGYEKSRGKYIVLLNNDTKAEKNWLESLVNTISSDSKTGMVQSLVYTEGIPERYYRKNGTINLAGHNIMEVFDIGKDGRGSVFQVTGCSVIIRREVCELTGSIFDSDYHMYSEDTYLSFLARFAGFTSMHDSNSVVHHKGGGTVKKFRLADVTFYRERNRLMNFLVFFSRSIRIKLYVYFFFNFIAKIIASVFGSNYSLKGILRAYAWLLENKELIEKKRIKISGYKKVQEEEVLKLLSCKMFNGENIISRFVNYISFLYCRLTGINTIEMYK